MQKKAAGKRRRNEAFSPLSLHPPLYTPHHHLLMPFRIPFAGEGEFFTPDSVLSHCYGALLPMFDTEEALVLRQLCREFKTTVADFPWEDEDTVIRGSVAGWRACFPRARWANVSGYDEHINKMGRRTQVTDADFAHLVGVKRLNMMICRSITDTGLVHLKGIHTLDMSFCWQPTITDLAFSYLKGIHTLDISCCDQPTITDIAFFHLVGIHNLCMTDCTQPTITAAAFQHLKGVCLFPPFGCPLSFLAGALEAGHITKELAESIRQYASDYVAP
jgi:hypothetical protein